MQVVDTDEELKRSVISTLKYFHIFQHPLYAHEIQKFLSVRISRQDLSFVLNDMVRCGTIFCEYGMYSLTNSSQVYLKRLVGSDIAAEKMKEANRSARLIARFPFVKCVCVSGSLSKGYADENSDIDFFIITAHKRLWICRTLLHLFKKVTFIINKQHSFCMNYFIDEQRMCLEEQNIFTATELSTLIPLYNTHIHDRLLDDNIGWIKNHFPNMNVLHDDKQQAKQVKTLKTLAEKCINWFRPEATNSFLMRLTDRVWRYKWRKKNYPMADYDLAMKTKWYVSKQHPLNYQKKVLEQHRKEPYLSTAVGI